MIRAILTIDDVPSRVTPAIVDYLNERGIQALMFAVGQHIRQNWDQGVYALRHGMILGNHSDSHRHFSGLSFEDAVADIQRCDTLLTRLYSAAGVERKYKPFRFPYGDKGGEQKAALQRYFIQNGFHKLRDDQIPFPWWKQTGLNRDIDTLWTYDFMEYRLRPGSDFTKEALFDRMCDGHPASGAPLYADGARHILLLHAHDETEEMLPGYYRLILDDLLAHGVTFDKPEFFPCQA